MSPKEVARQFTTSTERLVALEVNMDNIGDNFDRLEGRMSSHFEKVDEDLASFRSCQAKQTVQLELLSYQLSEVKDSLLSVTSMVQEAKNYIKESYRPPPAPKSKLEVITKIFSKENVTLLRSVAYVAISILGVAWGYLEYLGISNILTKVK